MEIIINETYEGKVKKTIFLQNFVYVLWTTTHHMLSFIDFYPFSSKFSDLNFASYVVHFTQVMFRDRNSWLPVNRD